MTPGLPRRIIVVIYLFRLFMSRNTTVGGDATVIIVDGILILVVTSYHSHHKWQDAKQCKGKLQVHKLTSDTQLIVT